MYPHIFFTDEISLPKILAPRVTPFKPFNRALINLLSQCLGWHEAQVKGAYIVSKSLGIFIPICWKSVDFSLS